MSMRTHFDAVSHKPVPTHRVAHAQTEWPFSRECRDDVGAEVNEQRRLCHLR